MSEFLDTIEYIVIWFQNQLTLVTTLTSLSLPLGIILLLFFPLCVGVFAVIVRVLVDM